MPIDFTKLGTANSANTSLEPATIFSALPRAGGRYSYLRDVQGDVLRAWFARRTEQDLVLKMNTGAGKTIVGLLMLKSCLNEGAGPAAYITPDNYLADQVALEADALGIAVTREIDRSYLTSKAILVHNIDKIFNGRTKFGINGNTDLGSIVIDDTHSCLRTIQDRFTIRLEPAHPAYEAILGIFRESLEQQSLTATLDVVAGDPSKQMLVPFWSWRDQIRDVTTVLHSHRDDTELEWQWPLLRNTLENCSCIIAGNGLTVSSRCINSSVVTGFTQAKRRIYTTATLADDSALVTHLDANPASIESAITPQSASDLGNRLILAPQELNPTISDDEIKAFVGKLATTWNVVVIVPSKSRADYWKDLAAQVLTASNLSVGVAKLKAGPVGLTVLVNKYDGVDLPDDACRVLVIDGVPEVNHWMERVDACTLGESEALLVKHIQRIEQGMGRGVRSNEDHCVVLLLGAKLITRISSPAARDMFTPATLAQLDLSRQVSEQIHGKTLGEIREAMDLCLKSDPQWLAAHRNALAGAQYGRRPTKSYPVQQRMAYNAALLGRYDGATSAMQEAVNSVNNDDLLAGWLKEQLADYTHARDPVAAQQIQLSAQSLNPRVSKPKAGISYVKLAPATQSQTEALHGFLRGTYKTANELLLGYGSILDDLFFRPNSFRSFEAGLKALGFHLGFAAQRPEIEFGRGPDNLWALGGMQFVIFECKNEATAATISKSYIDKSSGRRNWFGETYGPGCTAANLIVHPSRIVSSQASPDPEMRVLTPLKLGALKDACHRLAVALASQQTPDVTATGEFLRQSGLTAEALVETYTEKYLMEN